MDTAQNTLFELDLFELLQLAHLPEEEKVERLLEIQQIVLTDFITNDLPELLAKEDYDKVWEIFKNENGDEIDAFLKEKIPDYEELILAKLLIFKKELVLDNFKTRIDILAQRREELRQEPDSDQKTKELLQVEKDFTKYTELSSAVENSDWQKVNSLL